MRVGIRRWGAVGRACGERAKSCEWWAGEREREPERGEGKGREGKGGEGKGWIDGRGEGGEEEGWIDGKGSGSTYICAT